MKIKDGLRLLLAVIMMYVGVQHFRHSAPFVQIVPRFLPDPLALVLISGFFEVLGGAGLLIPQVRRAAAWGLVALYIAVFPANVNMAAHHIPINGTHIAPLLLWLRLPLQLLLIAWAWWCAAPESEMISRHNTRT